jgi:predicted permease
MAMMFIQIVPLPVEQIPILILFSALPPAILNFLVAERFDQQPHQVASIVLIGNLVSVAIIPVILWIII